MKSDFVRTVQPKGLLQWGQRTEQESWKCYECWVGVWGRSVPRSVPILVVGWLRVGPPPALSTAGSVCQPWCLPALAHRPPRLPSDTVRAGSCVVDPKAPAGADAKAPLVLLHPPTVGPLLCLAGRLQHTAVDYLRHFREVCRGGRPPGNGGPWLDRAAAATAAAGGGAVGPKKHRRETPSVPN